MAQYRYYTFTLPPYLSPSSDKRVPRVTNLTVTLNSLHGDADLFVSRLHKYPNRIEFERNSVRTVDSYDVVYFDDKTGDTDLSATYYIAVYSYQYSTYSIQVSVERENLSDDAKKPSWGKTLPAVKPVQSLIEGVTVRGQLVSSDDDEVYQINVK